MAAIVTLPAFGLGYAIKADVSKLANNYFVLSENSSSKQSYT
jgi:hypothetical protein